VPQARISVVHAIGSLRIGGAERQLAELISRLPADRFEQQLVLVEQEFSVDRMVGEFADLYQQLVDDAAAPRDARETGAAEAPGTYTRPESGPTPGGPPR